jgi:hypothetical protein
MTAAGLNELWAIIPKSRATLITAFGCVCIFSIVQLYAETYDISWLPHPKMIPGNPGWRSSNLRGPFNDIDPIIFSQADADVSKISCPNIAVHSFMKMLFAETAETGSASILLHLPVDVASVINVKIRIHNLLISHLDGPELRIIDDPLQDHVIPDYVVRMGNTAVIADCVRHSPPTLFQETSYEVPRVAIPGGKIAGDISDQ